jgi:hypothetical protein
MCSPDSLPIGAAKPQEVFQAVQNSSCACGTPIAKLKGPPAIPDQHTFYVPGG